MGGFGRASASRVRSPLSNLRWGLYPGLWYFGHFLFAPRFVQALSTDTMFLQASTLPLSVHKSTCYFP